MGKMKSTSKRPVSAVNQGPTSKGKGKSSQKNQLDRIMDSTQEQSQESFRADEGAKPLPFNREGRQKAVDAQSEAGTESPSTTVSQTSLTEGMGITVLLTLRKTNKNFALYDGEGIRGGVRFLKTQFDGAPPENIEVGAANFAVKAPKAPKVKETREERKARLAARTPQQIAADAQARAQKAVERANKLAAKAAEAETVSA